MIRIRTPMLALAAMVAAGLVAVIDMAQSRPQDASPLSASPASTAVATRFPQIDEMMVTKFIVPAQSKVVFAPKAATPQSDKVFVPTEACVHEHWPYIADECLVARDGAKVQPPARTITTERRLARTAPAPARIPAQIVASR